MKDFLKSARIRAKLSQRDVSNKLGYTTAQFVSNWERGISTPPVKDLKTLCKMYKVDFEMTVNMLISTKVNDLTRSILEQIASLK
jgi:transcriptional regulator with XRE-family HTH domain